MIVTTLFLKDTNLQKSSYIPQLSKLLLNASASIAKSNCDFFFFELSASHLQSRHYYHLSLSTSPSVIFFLKSIKSTEHLIISALQVRQILSHLRSQAPSMAIPKRAPSHLTSEAKQGWAWLVLGWESSNSVASRLDLAF
jgi:hypothetical protein